MSDSFFSAFSCNRNTDNHTFLKICRLRVCPFSCRWRGFGSWRVNCEHPCGLLTSWKSTLILEVQVIFPNVQGLNGKMEKKRCSSKSVRSKGGFNTLWPLTIESIGACFLLQLACTRKFNHALLYVLHQSDNYLNILTVNIIRSYFNTQK